MIRKLVLKDFGRFKNREFDFDKVTVFFGKNEAGKTTIFDSLMIKLTNVGKNFEEGRQRLYRYGNYNSKSIEIVSDEKDIPVKIFKNVFAVGAGEISLNLSDKKFSDEISSKILQDEINLNLFIENVKKNTEDKATLAINKKIKEYFSKIQELENKKNEIAQQLNFYKSIELKITEENKNLKEKSENFKKYSLNLKELKEKLENKRKIKELNEKKKDYENIFGKFIKIDDIKSKIEKLKEVNKEKLNFYKAKSEEIPNLKAKKELLEETIGKLKTQLKEKEEAKKRTLDNLKELEKKKEILEKLEELNKIRLHEIINIISLVFFLIISVIFFRKFFIVSIFSLFLFLISALYSVFNFITKKKKKEKLLSSFTDIKNLDLKMLEEELIKGKNSVEEFLEKEIEDIKKEIEKNEQDYEEKRKILENLINEVNEYLVSNSVRSFEELLAKDRERNNFLNEMKEIESSILSRFKNLSLEEIRKMILLELRKIDENLNGEDFDENEYIQIQKDIKFLEEKVTYLDSEVKKLNESIAEKKGRLSLLPKIMENYQEIQKELEINEVEYKKLIDKKNAYRKMLLILQEISEDVNFKFKRISEEISNEFGKFFPHFEKVELTSLDRVEDIAIRDNYGKLRKITHLSTGTRDMFLLAFRILLARRFGAKFLIFDEPFLALDKERMDKMLDIIKDFYDKNDCQLIFFTKDEYLKERIKRKFDSLKIEELDE